MTQPLKFFWKVGLVASKITANLDYPFIDSVTLFRHQAVAAQQTQILGEIVLIRPLSFTYLTVLAVTFASMLAGFLIWGSYTRHSSVSGQLSPYSGVLNIYAPQAGIVVEKHVAESQFVHAGDPLYVLSSERQSSRIGNTQASISEQVDQRLASLREDLDKTRVLQQKERDGLTQKISALQQELTQLSSQIEVQRSQIKLVEESVSRYSGLLAEHFTTQDQLQQKQAELLDQQLRQQSLQRERISIGRELSAQQSLLSGLGLVQQNQIARLERQISSANQELTESEAKRRLVVTAPQSGTGTATAVLAEVGQAVDSSQPLVSIVPENATLRAKLYAPSRAIGFVKPGDKVLIRYQAYPYQKFGHHQGIVESVSKTALPANEASALTNVIRDGSTYGEPMYLINVKLAEQSINAYGQSQALQSGMLLDADILLETRRLYEWVLEPLYSLSGKL